ncbi:MAG: YitT family protein [Eubacterium sp.]|nr:YitT family protein [Eubacterium sp.]
MKSKIRENTKILRIFEYIGILFGTFLTAVAVNMFMIPNKLAPGGYSGVATVLYYTTGLPVGTMTFVFSVATQLISLKVLGRSMGLKSFICTLSYGIMVDIMNGRLPQFSEDVLLASIFAGVLYGVGMGVLYRMGGSGGGTDLLARMLHKFTRRLSLSTWIMCVDFCVIILAGLVFRDLSVMLYSIIVLFLYTQVMNFVIVGNNYSKAANIVSEHSREICDRIRDELNKSATIFHAYGAYSGESKDVVYCIVYRNQISRLKQLIYEVDPNAFVTLSDVQEVLGQGFKRIDEE